MRAGYPLGVLLSRIFGGMVLALAAAPAAEAAAALPAGSPQVRLTRAADHAEHPSVFRERWHLRLLDPRSHAALEVVLQRADDEFTGATVSRRPPSGKVLDDGDRTGGSGTGGTPRATRGRVTSSTPEYGSIVLDVRRGGVAVAVATYSATGSIEVRRARRGPAALGYDLGRTYGNTVLAPRQTLSWTTPIATGVASGRVTIGGHVVDVDGWRASYEHHWGDFFLGDDAHDHWDSAVVHQRGGRAWMVGGINRRDTITGPGAREAQWMGVLARAGPRGTRLCRPPIRRRRWTTPYAGTSNAVYARRLTARCGGMRATFRDAERLTERVEGGDWFLAEGPARLRGRAGDGWVVHRGT